MRMASGMPPTAVIADLRKTAELMAMKQDRAKRSSKISPSGKRWYSWAWSVVRCHPLG